MSYDIQLIDPITKQTLRAESSHNFKGGTFAINGTTELWLNITWNYFEIFRKVLGEKGIRVIYGLTGEESQPILKQAIDQLSNNDVVSVETRLNAAKLSGYWKPTERNAKEALAQLWCMAELRPDGIWEGD